MPDFLPLASRRAFLGSLAATAISACTGSSTLGLVASSVRAVLNKSPSGNAYPVTAAQIAALPYATLGFRYAKEPPAVMVLARDRNGELEWASSDNAVIVTRGGRILHSSGLARDVATDYPYGPDPIRDPTTLAPLAPLATEPVKLVRTMDFRNPEEIGVEVRSLITPAGTETIQILGKSHVTEKYREQVTVAQWNWKAENFYWIGSDDRRVWRSSQTLTPDTGVITLELLKPPARG